MLVLILTFVNIFVLVGSIQAYRAAHAYADGAGKFMNRAETIANRVHIISTSADHDVCSSCKSIVARFDRRNDGSVICANCK